LAGPLFGLLKVFQEGNLKDYNAYLQSNGGESVLTQWSLSPEGCSKNMRVLSLCSFASENEEIPYSTVAEKMDVPPTDVEKWVITAVSSGLLSAKMDQMEQKVLVERCVVRKCDIEQWRALQARLHLWRDNIGEVLKQAMKAQSVQ
jgi:translation initiation factor 3 subunit M